MEGKGKVYVSLGSYSRSPPFNGLATAVLAVGKTLARACSSPRVGSPQKIVDGPAR